MFLVCGIYIGEENPDRSSANTIDLDCSKCALLSFARRRIPTPMVSLNFYPGEYSPIVLSSRMCMKGTEDEATDYDVAVLAPLIARRL